MAQLTKTPYPLPALKIDWSKGLTKSEHYKAFEAIDEPMIRFGVADGYAHYVVKSTKPLILQHVPFLDGYRADPTLIRGLRKKDVDFMLECNL